MIDRALAQVPVEHVQALEILIRCDLAGATHGLVDYCADAGLRFSVGYELTEQVHAEILKTPADDWIPAVNPDGTA